MLKLQIERKYHTKEIIYQKLKKAKKEKKKKKI